MELLKTIWFKKNYISAKIINDYNHLINQYVLWDFIELMNKFDIITSIKRYFERIYLIFYDRK